MFPLELVNQAVRLHFLLPSPLVECVSKSSPFGFSLLHLLFSCFIPVSFFRPACKEEKTEKKKKKMTDAAKAIVELTKHLKEQSLQRIAPFRVKEAQLASERESIAGDSEELQHRTTLDMAKSKQFYPEEVMMLTYVQYGKAEAQRFYVGLLQRKSGLQRVVAHNFYVAAHCEPSFIATWGDVLTYCPYPLFPSGEGFTALNRTLLAEVQAAYEMGHVIGGDSTQPRDIPRPTVFKPTHAAVPTGGEYRVAVENGQVNLTEVEDSYVALKRDVDDLRQTVYSSLQGQPRGRGRGSYGPSYGPSYRGAARAPKVCYSCGKEGHIARECRSSRRQPKGGDEEVSKRSN